MVIEVVRVGALAKLGPSQTSALALDRGSHAHAIAEGGPPQVCTLLPSLDRGRVAGCRWTLSLTLFAHDEGLGGQKKAPRSASGLTVWGHHGRVSPWGQKPIHTGNS
jgi:hypothetical protein